MHIFYKGTREEEYQRMITKPVSNLVLSLAIPTVTSMLVSSLYNMADTYFVSKLGTSASGAVGIVFSLMAIIQAIGFTLGMGCGSLISRKLGEKDNDAADRYGSSAFFVAIGFGLLITVFGLIYIDPLMMLLGSTETILPYARDYGLYIIIGAPLMCASFVMNNILRSEGHAAFSMIALTSGGFINIILDPIFIFSLKLGTAGAAMATLISQCISFSLLLQFFLRKKGIVHIRISCMSRKFRDYGLVIVTGFPSLCRQGLASVSTAILNNQASAYGDSAVAGISIVMRIVVTVAAVMIGIGQGFTPVSGYNYGAKKYSRVKEAYRFTVMLGTAILTVGAVILIVFAPQIIKWFRDDPEVIKVGARALRFQSVALPLHGLVIGTNMLMQSTGKQLQATFLACNRQGVYFIPLIIVLPIFFGLTGIEATQACADVLSAITAVPYVLWFMKKLPKE